MEGKGTASKSLAVCISVIILLVVCLTVTTYALVLSMVSVENNVFTTGTISINLNNGEPIVDEAGLLLEPGMTVKRDFFLANNSSCEVYYRLYFKDVKGNLADVLRIEIRDGDKVLYKGTPSSLTLSNISAADDMLGVNEKRELQMYLHMEESTSNAAQGMSLSFDLVADAVQAKNNTDKSFD